MRLQPRGQVDAPADGRELDQFVRAEVADRHLSLVDADAEGEVVVEHAAHASKLLSAVLAQQSVSLSVEQGVLLELSSSELPHARSMPSKAHAGIFEVVFMDLSTRPVPVQRSTGCSGQQVVYKEARRAARPASKLW